VEKERRERPWDRGWVETRKKMASGKQQSGRGQAPDPLGLSIYRLNIMGAFLKKL